MTTQQRELLTTTYHGARLMGSALRFVAVHSFCLIVTVALIARDVLA